VRVFFTAPRKNQRSYGDGTQKNMARSVWQAPGVQQSLEDIGNFDGAANFAAFIEDARIVAVRELVVLPGSEIAV